MTSFKATIKSTITQEIVRNQLKLVGLKKEIHQTEEEIKYLEIHLNQILVEEKQLLIQPENLKIYENQIRDRLLIRRDDLKHYLNDKVLSVCETFYPPCCPLCSFQGCIKSILRHYGACGGSVNCSNQLEGKTSCGKKTGMNYLYCKTCATNLNKCGNCGVDWVLPRLYVDQIEKMYHQFIKDCYIRGSSDLEAMVTMKIIVLELLNMEELQSYKFTTILGQEIGKSSYVQGGFNSFFKLQPLS